MTSGMVQKFIPHIRDGLAYCIDSLRDVAGMLESFYYSMGYGIFDFG